MKSILRRWIPLAGMLTLMVGLLYASVQQVHRSGADDPQIQMAEDAASRLNAGASLKDVVPFWDVELAASLSPFLNVYDASGQAVAGNGLLHGDLPAYPLGALEAAGDSGQNRVTWAPEDGVRIASVVAAYDEGYVVAGRSLREVEARVARLNMILLMGWGASLAASLVLVWASEALFKE